MDDLDLTQKERDNLATLSRNYNIIFTTLFAITAVGFGSVLIDGIVNHSPWRELAINAGFFVIALLMVCCRLWRKLPKRGNLTSILCIAWFILIILNR